MDFDHSSEFTASSTSSAAVAPTTCGWDSPRPAPMLDSQALLRGEREVLIGHAGQTYRLRHTRNGKLILTK